MKKALTMILIIILINIKSYSIEFNDLSRYEHAYIPINKLAEEGIMVGSSDGVYKPEEKVTKYYFLKIMAKMVGYKEPIISTVTDEDIKMLGGLYTKYYEVISKYRDMYKTWDKTLEKPIMFLLDKKLLKEEYLKDIIIRKENIEKENTLTKNELAFYIVKIMEFLNVEIENEEAPLDTIYKLGIMKNDNNNEIIKADLAIYLYLMKNYIEEKDVEDKHIVGKIDNINNDIIQIIDSNNSTNLYILSENVKQKISFLKKGMKIKGVESNYVLKEIESVLDE